MTAYDEFLLLGLDYDISSILYLSIIFLIDFPVLDNYLVYRYVPTQSYLVVSDVS